MTQKTDWKIDSPEFEFEMKALMSDKTFVESIKKEWDRLIQEGKAEKDVQHIIEMMILRKVGERIENPPDEPNFN